MPDDTVTPLIPRPNYVRSFSPAPTDTSHQQTTTMEALGLSRAAGPPRHGQLTWVVIASYAFDWIILIVAAGVGYVLGEITPNMRPFSLTDPDISFPYTVNETVPVWLLVIIADLIPIALIAIISLIFVPGATVPRGTPKSMVWKRKLWELHAGWLGLALSIVSAWFITNGMKNLFGKPRPDLLDRCQPDYGRIAEFAVGGLWNVSTNGQLVSAKICTQTDKHIFDDGFRSYPSGHSSNAASGLLYLSLFIASKFAITIPFFPTGGQHDAQAYTAFPSRLRNNNLSTGPESYELPTRGQNGQARSETGMSQKGVSKHNQEIFAARRQAAAAPLYLLLIAVLPFFAAIFIASSRWFDFRHHGFDILFGFLIGTVSAIFSFRYYHLPISSGAGWAWGPRSHGKAFWAGVGSFSYATDHIRGSYRTRDEEQAVGLDGASDPYGRGNGLQSSGGIIATGRKPQTMDERHLDTAYSGAGSRI